MPTDPNRDMGKELRKIWQEVLPELNSDSRFECRPRGAGGEETAQTKA